MPRKSKEVQVAELASDAAAAALLAHVAAQYVDGRSVERLIAQIVAGCGNAIVAGIHRLPPSKWPTRPLSDEEEST